MGVTGSAHAAVNGNFARYAASNAVGSPFTYPVLYPFPGPVLAQDLHPDFRCFNDDVTQIESVHPLRYEPLGTNNLVNTGPRRTFRFQPPFHLDVVGCRIGNADTVVRFKPVRARNIVAWKGDMRPYAKTAP